MVIIERVLLVALACVVFGHYVAALLFAATGYARFLGNATTADLSTLIALVLLGSLWLRARRGHLLTPAQRARHVWLAVGILRVLLIWAGRDGDRAVGVAARGHCRSRACRRAAEAGATRSPTPAGSSSRRSPPWDARPRRSASPTAFRASSTSSRRRGSPACAARSVITSAGGAAADRRPLAARRRPDPAGADPRWASAPLAGLAQFLAPSWITRR